MFDESLHRDDKHSHVGLEFRDHRGLQVRNGGLDSLSNGVVVKISTNEGRRCPIREGFLDGTETEKFEAACKHLLEHGLKLRHVGQETIYGSEGPWQTTVAVFGPA